MFRKIVSNLPFSPALIGQLSFYAKRLRKEEATRRLGIFFIILALIVQSLAVFQPPESANAASSNDFVPGGLGLGENRSLNNFLAPYDANTNKLRDVMNYAGITRAEITATQFTSFKVGDKLSWGYHPTFSYEQGERQHNIFNSEGQQVETVYSRPLNLRNDRNDDIWGWVGHSEKMGWFAIMQACGNLVTDTVPKIIPKCVINPSLPADDINCKPCPGNDKLWIDDPTCVANIIKSKTAINTTQGSVDATTIKAKTNDQISYTITTENKGLKSVSVKIEEDLTDVLEYSTVIDNGGGTLNATAKTLTWPDVTIAPNTTKTNTFKVKILSTLPETTTETTPLKDCVMTNIYGNTVNIDVNCSAPKCLLNPNLPAADPSCKPCPGNDKLWIDDPTCIPNIVKSKTAINITQNSADATKTKAEANDQISYTITTENKGLKPIDVKLEEGLMDVLEYSTIVDNGGGSLNTTTKVLTWPITTVSPGTKQSRTFIVKMQDTIPATAQGASNNTSYDCIMTNTFGNAVEIGVNCPTPKVIEQVTSELPKTGATENMLFIGIVLAIAVYFYTRTREINKEIRLVRKNVNIGTI